jgi:uncharacterized protein YndB with AHSA1/START domain
VTSRSPSVEKVIKRAAGWNVDSEPTASNDMGLAQSGQPPCKRMASLIPSAALLALRFRPTVQKRLVVVRRKLEAPVWRVFCIFAEPEHSMRGWALRDFTLTTVENAFRPGGSYRVCLRSPEASEHWIYGTYQEVVPFSRIAFTHRWEENGATSPETLVTVTVSQEGCWTQVTLEQTSLESERECALHRSGWHECFDSIAAHLTATRFASPRPCASLGLGR